MVTTNDPLFKKYVAHVLRWEGKTSKDPNDTAASCAPFAGAYHTNKGVTFCTFKKIALQLGITPVSYQRFVQLTDEDVSKFILYFCEEAGVSAIETRIALAVTEAAWGSGPDRAVRHLQTALNNLGQKVSVDGEMGTETFIAITKTDPEALYDEYWKERRMFLDRLTSQAKYARYKTGWNNRVNAFLKLFSQ